MTVEAVRLFLNTKTSKSKTSLERKSVGREFRGPCSGDCRTQLMAHNPRVIYDT